MPVESHVSLAPSLIESPLNLSPQQGPRSAFVREIIDAKFTPQDAKVLQLPGFFVRRDRRNNLIATDSFPPAAPTKRMIVEENVVKGKIFFRRAIEGLVNGQIKTKCPALA
jgi:hypothetical protein